MARVNTKDIKEVDQQFRFERFLHPLKKMNDFRVYMLGLFLNYVQKINLKDEYCFMNVVKPQIKCLFNIPPV